MSFVSIEFLLLFGIALAVLPFIRNIPLRNMCILGFSCIFYAWWSVPHLFLMLSICFIAYISALWMRKGKFILWLAISLIVLTLIYFKYYTFLLSTLGALGGGGGSTEKSIILPLGISFITFQMIAYVVDVYKQKVAAEKNPVDFFAFALFFPQLVAGPIERAASLLPQFKTLKTASREDAELAVGLLVYAYFLKVFIADHAGLIADSVFGQATANGWSVIFGSMAFGLQIYADFFAYSLMAIGFAKLLGFNLSLNFNRPYWSTEPREFWSRWHITLSSWIRDYLYIPLGGNRHGTRRMALNLLLCMGLAGLWHGAGWNFVIWGLWWGAALVAWRLVVPPEFTRKPLGRALGWLVTLLVAFIGWFFFRVHSLEELSLAGNALKHWEFFPANYWQLKALLFLGGILFVIEFFQRRAQADLPLTGLHRYIKYACLGVMLLCTLVFYNKNILSFIYFQF